MSNLYQNFPHFWHHDILRKVQRLFQCWEFPEEQSSVWECEENISSQPSPFLVSQPSLQTRGELQCCCGASPLQPQTANPPQCFQTPFRLSISCVLNELFFSLYDFKIEDPISCELIDLWFNFCGGEEEAMASDTGKFMSCLSSLHKRLQG